jgi:hypothetical protein
VIAFAPVAKPALAPHRRFPDDCAAGLAVKAVFYGLTMLLNYVFIARTPQPLSGTTEQVGDGRYRTGITGRMAPGLSRLRGRFNRMAARLAARDAESKGLNGQLRMVATSAQAVEP